MSMMSFRNYIDAVEHLYDCSVFHGTPEVYEVNPAQQNGEYDIAFKLNLQALSDSTVVGGTTWERLKQDAFLMRYEGKWLPVAERITLHNLIAAQTAQGDMTPLQLQLDTDCSSECR